MRSVTCSLAVSLDGFVVGPDGGFSWAAPDEEVFAFATEEVRGLGVHLLGRRLYETMLYWETAEQDPGTVPLEREFAALWNGLEKVVLSRTLTSVQGSYRLAGAGLAAEVERWRSEPGDGAIGIGGAELAGEAAALDLVDEYRLRVCPVLVGGGRPFFPQHGRRTDLELVGTRTFASGVVHLRYRVLRRA